MPNGNPAPGPLNSRYFRPVRGKETRARRWDLQFESTSLQRRVRKPSIPRERSASLQSAAVIHTKGTSYRYNRALSRFGRRKVIGPGLYRLEPVMRVTIGIKIFGIAVGLLILMAVVALLSMRMT